MTLSYSLCLIAGDQGIKGFSGGFGLNGAKGDSGDKGFPGKVVATNTKIVQASRPTLIRDEFIIENTEHVQNLENF